MAKQLGLRSANAYNLTEKAYFTHDGTDVNLATDKGSFSVSHTASKSRGYWTLSGIPTATQTITVGAESWTFVETRSGANEITIGADAATTVDNMVSAINTDSTVVDAYDYGSVCVVEWATAGYIGNSKGISDTATNVTSSGEYLTGGQDATGAFIHEYFCPSNALSKGGSAAAEGVLNGMFYWVLDATNEYLYSTIDVHEDWDADQDLWITVVCSLNAAETANDKIRMSVLCNYFGEHENITTSKTQTIPVDHDIGNYNAEGDVHKLRFLVNWDLVDNVVERGDYFAFRLWLDDVSSEETVAGVRVHYVNLKYTKKYACLPMTSSIPVTG